MAKRRARATIHDVASAAGVSPTTVSDALNRKGRVDPGTRERVERVARRLGYRASRTARGLRSGRTGTLGLVLPEGRPALHAEEFIGVDFYIQLAAAAARAAFAREHALALLPPVSSVDDLRQFALDGAILNDPVERDPRLDAFDELGLPVVTIDRDVGRPDRRLWVASDNAANTRALLDHLAAAGARRIALLAVDATWSWTMDTAETYAAWCAERGAAPIVEVAPLEALAGGRAIAAVGALLDRRPDAVITPPERFAVAVARAAAERGLRVGENVLLAAGVDSAQARDNDPPVTAIDLRPDLQAAAAVDLLISCIEGDAGRAPRIVPGELRARASTRAT